MVKEVIDTIGTLVGLKIIGKLIGEDEEKKPPQKVEQEETRKDKVKSIIIVILMLSIGLGILFFNQTIMGKGKIHPPKEMDEYVGENYLVVKDSFKSAGFTNIKILKEDRTLLEITKKKDTVKKITINGDSVFNTSSWYTPNAIVRIIVYA